MEANTNTAHLNIPPVAGIERSGSPEPTRSENSGTELANLETSERITTTTGLLEAANYEPITPTVPVTTGLVTAATLNLRMDPSTNNEPIGSVARNDSLRVLSVDDGWALVVFNGEKAYVSAEYLTLSSKEEEFKKLDYGVSVGGSQLSSAINELAARWGIDSSELRRLAIRGNPTIRLMLDSLIADEKKLLPDDFSLIHEEGTEDYSLYINNVTKGSAILGNSILTILKNEDGTNSFGIMSIEDVSYILESAGFSEAEVEYSISKLPVYIPNTVSYEMNDTKYYELADTDPFLETLSGLGVIKIGVERPENTQQFPAVEIAGVRREVVYNQTLEMYVYLDNEGHPRVAVDPVTNRLAYLSVSENNKLVFLTDLQYPEVINIDNASVEDVRKLFEKMEAYLATQYGISAELTDSSVIVLGVFPISKYNADAWPLPPINYTNGWKLTRPELSSEDGSKSRSYFYVSGTPSDAPGPEFVFASVVSSYSVPTGVNLAPQRPDFMADIAKINPTFTTHEDIVIPGTSDSEEAIVSGAK